MPTIHFITHDGSRHTVQGIDGKSLMQTALDNCMPGIDGDCGGQCACGTCHVYVDKGWVEQVGSADAREADMLDFTDCRRDGSRLACQITLTPRLDGLVVTLPQGQR